MVSESWTSKKCYKCNKKGVRPRQDAFYCSNYHCIVRINADLNGAANIAKRGIMYKALVEKKEYPTSFMAKKVVKQKLAPVITIDD